MRIKIQRENLAEVAQILFEVDKKAFNRDFDLPSKDVAEQKRYLRGSIIFVAYDEENPVGFFAYKHKGSKEIEIKTIAVIPEYQRRGIGKLMMKKLMKLVKGYNVKTVTHPYNTAAIILYLRYGFQISAWNDNYYGDRQPRLLLRLLQDRKGNDILLAPSGVD